MSYSPATFMPCDLTVCMLDIFCSGPSILHMPSSFLQASSSLSSHQPGTVCRNIQTCCEIARQLDPSRLWKWELNKRSRTKPPDLSISHPRKEKTQQFDYKIFGDMLPAQLGLNWWISYHKFRVIVDVLAVLAGAPLSSMQLYATGEWPPVGSF